MRNAILIMFIFLTVTACGPRWYYPHLDWLLPWYVGDYISLNTSQRGELATRLARHLLWHCQTQVPSYAAFLREIKSDLENPPGTLTSDRIWAYAAALKAYWKDLIRRIGPDVAEILATASDDQIAELYKNIEQDNRELEYTYVDIPVEEIFKNRTARMTDRLEHWIGTLSDDQMKAVQQWSYQLGKTADQWIANRRRVQKAFWEILATRHDDPAFRQAFITLLTWPETRRTERYQQLHEHRTHLTVALLAEIGAMLTPAQRTHFLEKLEALSADFDMLTCQPDSSALSETAAQPQP